MVYRYGVGTVHYYADAVWVEGALVDELEQARSSPTPNLLIRFLRGGYSA